MFWASIFHHFSIISSLFYTISHHLSSLYMFRIDLHACCIFVLISGDLELLTSYLEEADLIMSNHSTPRSSRKHHHSISPLYLEVEYHHHHHSTAYSMTSFRAFFIPHSTRHSSTRKKRRLQLLTRPLTRPLGSTTVLNPSQYFVVLSIRVSKYLAISSMYFTFSKTSFYLVLFRRPCVLDLL